MMQISLRALLSLVLLVWLFVSGQFNYLGNLPGWAVLVMVGFYQLPWQFAFWLPGQRKKVIAQIEAMVKQQQEQSFNSVPKNLKATDIN